MVIFNTVLAFVVATVLTFILTPLAKKIAYRVGAIDVPRDDRRMHKEPIPRLGGLAIFFGFLISVIIFVPVDRECRGILLGALIIVLLGVVDDSVTLPALLKLVVQIIAALVVVYHGLKIDVMTNLNLFSDKTLVSLGIWSVPITVIWIAAITNSVNLIDGLDGLSVGVCAIASVSLLVIAALVGETTVMLVVAAIAGACLGFLPYNINPAKMFAGDTGATFLGFALATVSIQGMFKTYAILSLVVPLLILGLPIFDTVFAICRRLLSGKSPMHADRGHIHHRLIDMGFSQKQTVAILYLISVALGATAILLTMSGPARALLFVVVVILVTLFSVRAYSFISVRRKRKKNKDKE